MSGSSDSTAVERARREADLKGVELDAVREVDTDAEGVTVRVLAQDADDEADQVGFEVTRPPGDMGEQIFGQRLSDGIRQLKSHLRDSDDTDSTNDSEETSENTEDAETSDEDPRGDVPTGSTTNKTSEPATHVGDVEMQVSLSDDALEAVRTDLEEIFEEFEEQSVDTERVDEIDDRLDDLDDRLSVLEDQLSMLGSVGSNTDD